jgi:mono/diheme cytochrome c family protein
MISLRHSLLLGCVVAGAAACGADEQSPADPGNAAQVARGQAVYQRHCASCHGANLEGQPDWRRRLPNGRLPAPPHDDTGHTWHHADDLLFRITKHGLVPPLAPEGYQSDMPGFASVLPDDDIWAVLAFIKSRWSREVLAARREMLDGSGRH